MFLASNLFLSLFITLTFIPIFKGIAVRANIMDVPNDRKVHFLPVPKIGGLAMAFGFCMPILLWLPFDRFVVSVIIGSIVLVFAGFVDDVYVLGYKQKLTGQVTAALIVIVYGGVKVVSLGMLLPDGIELPLAIALPLTLLIIVGITNAINLADGLDGLAGGISLMIFLCLCALAYKSGDGTATVICLAMLGALFGFLSFNTYPASVFMGDAGSQFLGFVAIVLALKITQGNSVLSSVLPVLVVGFPIIDMVIVVWERVRDGRSPFLGDKNHFHHKLLKLGLFHTEAVSIIYLIQFILVSSAYFFRFYSEMFILIFYAVFSGLVIFFFQATNKYNFRFKRYDLLDRVIKGKLRIFKDKKNILIISSFILYFLLPALLITHCSLSKGLPRYSSVLSFALALLIFCFWLMGNRVLGSMVRAVLYFMIPAVLYLSRDQFSYLSSFNLKPVYLGFFLMCLVSSIAVVRLNKNRNSFRASPMDFLILVVALCISPLLGSFMEARETRTFLIEVLIFFYSYEILLNEPRWGKTAAIATTIGALLIIALKGVFV